MSVPLDRLYDFLHDVVKHNVLIYGWSPHGSTKLEDLQILKDTVAVDQWSKLKNTLPDQEFKQLFWRDSHAVIICHDQEVLDFKRYSFDELKSEIYKRFEQSQSILGIQNLCDDKILNYTAGLGLRGLINVGNAYDLTLLLHSEQNSQDVNQFAKTGYVPVYYWSHGLIALDWFRFAEHDPTLFFAVDKFQKDFLIYNRAWTGSREYRLYFVEQLIKNNLVHACQTKFNANDGYHYTQHKFKNPLLQIFCHDIENKLETNNSHASASADYQSVDYCSTAIEVVLETVFDDTKWHLTEKILRPIACGKPFMLLSTPGSLQYLKQYGFETFGNWINEDYDKISDPQKRILCVIEEMKRITNLNAKHKMVVFENLHEIAQRNKQRFFGNFFNQVVEEYQQNIDQAMLVMQQHHTAQHRKVIQQLLNQQQLHRSC